jgi:SAM-dependent methyltransferase
VAAGKLDFAFDGRVSGQYDRQRQHPPAISERIGRFIAGLLPAAAEVLELGIGTGRIALPVMAAGCRVTGVDISADMLAQLQGSSTRHGAAPRLLRADISRLPLRESCFDGVTAVHVLHLVSGWEQALADALRVLRPGGMLLLGRDWIDPAGMAGQLQAQFRRVVLDIMGPQLKAPTGGRSVDAALREFGAEALHTGARELIAAEWETALSPEDILSAIRQRTYAESWVLPDDMLEPVDERMREFVAQRWPSFDAPQPVRRRFLIAAYRRPA